MRSTHTPFFTALFISLAAVAGYSQTKPVNNTCAWGIPLDAAVEAGATINHAVYKYDVGTLTVDCTSRDPAAKPEADVDAALDKIVARLKKNIPAGLTEPSFYIKDAKTQGIPGKKLWAVVDSGYLMVRVFATAKNLYVFSGTSPRSYGNEMEALTTVCEIKEERDQK